MQNDLEILNELILTYRHEIEINKKANQEKAIVSLFKPSNLTEIDNEKILSMDISQKTLFSLISFEQTTYDEDDTKISFEPNSIFNFIIKGYKIRISKEKFNNNIFAKIYNENELIDEIFSTDIYTLIEKLEFYCAQHLNILIEDYILN